MVTKEQAEALAKEIGAIKCMYSIGDTGHGPFAC